VHFEAQKNILLKKPYLRLIFDVVETSLKSLVTGGCFATTLANVNVTLEIFLLPRLST
jgi:hypothetical protein